MNEHKHTRSLARGGLLAVLTACAALVAMVLAAAPASASFGFEEFDVLYSAADSTPGFPLDNPPTTQAGSHPYALTTTIELNHTEAGFFEAALEGRLRTAIIEQVKGLSGDTTTVPRCSLVDFLSQKESVLEPPECPDASAVGATAIRAGIPQFYWIAPVWNLETAPGEVARLGFNVNGVTTIVDVRAKTGGDYNVTPTVGLTSEVLPVYGSVFELWGVPSDPAHDKYRGHCLTNGFLSLQFFSQLSEFNFDASATGNECPVSAPEVPFLTLPTECSGPKETHYEADSWEEPQNWVEGGVLTHDNSEPPNPIGFTGCGKLGYAPSIESVPTTNQAETGSGLDFNVDFHDEGLKNPNGLSQSITKKAEIVLPEGMTINPSIGEGLGVCTPADLARETLDSLPGEGCPNSSKIGSLRAEFPILEQPVEGSIYLAQQDDPSTSEAGAENPFDSLIALYFVLRNKEVGALAKLPVKVEPDPKTGRLVATLDNVPQFPFSHFNAHMREGVRAPLVSPPTCGTYTTEARLTPYSDPTTPRILTSSFEVTKGVGGGPCPPGGVPPFKPRFEAGSENNNAGSFSPFDMRVQRADGEQDMTKFSAVLPPGELGSLAGVSKCPDSAIATAKAKTGLEELANPSCPANSLIGHTLAGAGVGSALTYVKGYAYLGGPYHGDPLSVIAVTPAVAGPFDAGTVVVQEALTLNPKTAEVEVDGANSDPIPHIIKGIVLKLRDLRVFVDRPNFTLNPTSCDESSAKSVLFGSYINVLDPSDDRPVDLSTRFQAANCLNLGFKPHLALNLKGGTKRGGHPGLKAIYTPKKGDANVKGLVVRLPRSAFLDQAHIKTICTRVQFAAGNGNGEQCPKASQYGYIKAWTPLIEEPLEGPVFLRSSNHKLPDLVFALHGLVDIEVDTRIDSQQGGIRATVEEAPDAPLTKVDLRMQGAKKGLIINSRNLCGAPSHANVDFTGHNGKEFSSKPLMQPECGGKRKRKRGR